MRTNPPDSPNPAPIRGAGPPPVLAPVLSFVLLLCLALVWGLCPPAPAHAEVYTPPVERLRSGHPRVFFNADQVAGIKALTLPQTDEYYQILREWADAKTSETFPVADLGTETVAMALVYLVSDDEKYLTAAKDMLEKSIAYYRQCDQTDTPVSWYSTSRVNAITAYDMLYNQLSPSQRVSLGLDILQHVSAVQPDLEVEPPPGRNTGDHTGGFYGTPSLLWYAGLATYGEGINDALADEFLNQGYALHHQMLEHRRSVAGDDGGLVTHSLNYAFAAYPWAEFNFFHSMKAAFDLDIASQWPYVSYTPCYILWNLLPGAHWFGAGDAFHDDNLLPDLEAFTHLAQIAHFYGWSQKKTASLAGWLQTRFSNQIYSFEWPLTPFLLTGLAEAPPAQAPDSAALPLARYFKGMGQVFMRSGWGDDDVYAQFIAGGLSDQHKHLDEGGFAIYHKGFLALDSGSRPQVGDYQTSAHTYNYFPRTIAHNSLLIHMPGEQMPAYWGIPVEPTPNDGGQYNPIGGRLTAFETHPEFTFLASDLTGAYHPDKCALAERRMLFIHPRHFVIFDKVVSKSADQKKTWLLHTAQEPSLSGATFSAVHQDGRIVAQTLLPADPAISKVGGEGQQFWNDGRNWPLPDGFEIGNDHALVGQWRVEVSPSAAQTQDYFLHLIQVQDQGSADGPSPATLIYDEQRVGLEFTDNGLTASVVFTRGQETKARLILRKDGQTTDRMLTTLVQTQKGLGSSQPARNLLIISRSGTGPAAGGLVP